jgi:hypothetical protein
VVHALWRNFVVQTVQATTKFVAFDNYDSDWKNPLAINNTIAMSAARTLALELPLPWFV